MKKVLCLALSFVMVFSGLFALSGSAVVAEPERPETVPTTDYDGYPLVLVRGMDFNGLYYKLGTTEEERVFVGVKAGAVIKTLFKAIGTGLIHWSLESGVDVVLDYVDSILGKMACDTHGNSVYDVSVWQYEQSLANYPELWDKENGNEYGILKAGVEKLGADNVYYYNYDWRLDPYIHADAINRLIEQAKKDTGKDKVNLICCSMGGILTDSYIYKYGHESLNRVMFMSSTFCGVYVVSDLFNGRVAVDPYGLYMYANQSLAADKPFVGKLFGLIYKTGLFGSVSKLANKIIDRLIDQVYDGFLRDTFATMPVLWALVQPEDYESALEYMFGGQEEKYADIIAMSKEYQKMAAQRKDFLTAAKNDGVDVLVVASYDYSCIPVYPQAVSNGDGTLETAPMLGMAKVAPLGQTLGDSYTARCPERLSPDKVVDLSDAYFPDTTWAICGSPHVSGTYGTDFSEFIFWMATYDGHVTVDSNPDYPQFMCSSQKQNLEKFN